MTPITTTSTSPSSSSKRTKTFVLMSSLLFATTNAFHAQAPPSHPKRASIPHSPSKLQYTSADIPELAKAPELELEANIQTLLQDTVEKSAEKHKKGLDNLKTANSKAELRSAVLEDEDRLTVVRFHAPYCQSCKKMEPLMQSFARRNPDIQFIDVAYSKENSNRQLVHSLGVPSFPYCHVYHPASLGLVEEHSVNQKYWKDFSGIIESYQDGGCDLSPNPDDDGLYSNPYKSLSETLEGATVSSTR